ncbi:HD domain-containing phosphohydrolase [Mesotoga sp. BH458_6_3_2_1]|uniref:HD domain-containing phosphohydrolase n=1 Tax=Mesotoga sp. BH458_6_3_2_1 TaxID=1437446 RepID=UPI0028778511|nr:HD domain-containing phosphohydrolase [Mesotoga sp. BH458_6_3_2_1]
MYSRLREREEKFRAIVESTDDIIFELDRESRLTAIFGAWIESSEVNTDFFIGKTAAEIFPEGIAEVHMMNSEIALSGEQTTYEWSFGEDVNQKHYSINLSPIFDEEGLVTGLVGIGRDITKLKETEEALRRSRDDLLLTMSRLLKVKDPYTVDHQRKVEEIATAIAERLKLPNEKLEALRIASILHDIGKLSIPADILNKPGRLNEIEWALIKNHPDEGFKILKEIHFGLPVAEIVRQHHERIDGSGYPRGLKDGEIMLEARILAVADVVEAVSSHRPYRRALGLEIALEEIKSGVGTKYDEEVVKACLELFNSGFVPT